MGLPSKRDSALKISTRLCVYSSRYNLPWVNVLHAGPGKLQSVSFQNAETFERSINMHVPPIRLRHPKTTTYICIL